MRRLRERLWRSFGAEPRVTPSLRESEHVATIEYMESLRRAPVARSATHEEVIVAAWANLAIEERDLTLDEAKRLLRAT
jgi:hypothetical protein